MTFEERAWEHRTAADGLVSAVEDNQRLRDAIRRAPTLLRNPYDGGEYEDGEVPAVDVLRAALEG